MTSSYIGGEFAVPNYNVMGVAKASLEASVKYLAADLGQDNIRVNSISAGPIRTLSARGVGGFTSILKEIEERAPLRRNVDQEEVGKTAAYLLSDFSSGVTGKIFMLTQVTTRFDKMEKRHPPIWKGCLFDP